MGASKSNAAVTPPEVEQDAQAQTAEAVTPTLAEAPPDTAANAPEVPKRFAQVIAEQGLNLRAGPGREFPVLTVLDAEETVEVLALPQGLEVPGWVPVALFGTTGWLRTEFLRMLEE